MQYILNNNIYNICYTETLSDHYVGYGFYSVIWFYP